MTSFINGPKWNITGLTVWKETDPWRCRTCLAVWSSWGRSTDYRWPVSKQVDTPEDWLRICRTRASPNARTCSWCPHQWCQDQQAAKKTFSEWVTLLLFKGIPKLALTGHKIMFDMPAKKFFEWVPFSSLHWSFSWFLCCFVPLEEYMSPGMLRHR